MKTNSKDSEVCAEMRDSETEKKKKNFHQSLSIVLYASFHNVLSNCNLTRNTFYFLEYISIVGVSNDCPLHTLNAVLHNLTLCHVNRTYVA